MNIGIVGSGIAGLVVAFRLTQLGHCVSLFEKQAAIGMSAHNIRLDEPESCDSGDVPSRMFNEAQWPCLFALYRELGVQVKSVSPTQSFSDGQGKAYLRLQIAGRPWSNIKQLVKSKSRSMLNEASRMFEQGTRDLKLGIANDVCFKDYLNSKQVSVEFVNEFLYPTLSSTICTCSYSALDNYPARIILEILANLSGSKPDTTLYRTCHGTQDVVDRLNSGGIEVRTETEILSVRASAAAVEVVACDGRSYSFDHFVVATQANHVADIVPDLCVNAERMLSCFQYEPVSVVVHSDVKLMPSSQNDWETFNMVVSSRSNSNGKGPMRAMCSVWMNRFHDEWTNDRNVFQTINPIVEPDEARVLQRTVLQRPIVQQSSFEGWELLGAMNADSGRRIWYCGAYAEYGVPLLESGVVSAQNVVESIERSDIGRRLA